MGDDFDSMNIKNVGLLKIANISFDERELEAVLFYPKGIASI